jgi:glutamyl/glutaminyl-tRNA synthetase
MARVRFAPSPTGSLHLGSALTAVANRRFADEHAGAMLLRIDDTDPKRNVPGAEDEIVRDLEWLGVGWEEGPVRASERGERYRAAAARLLSSGDAFERDGFVRLRHERRATLLRSDGSATYHLASVVDDLDFGITHVIRGKDHLPNQPLHEALARALGAEPPEFVHHGLLLAPGGGKLSKRHGGGSLADLRAAGIPPEAVRAYLEELDLPRGDVHFDLPRLKRLAIDAIAAMPDNVLAEQAGAALRYVPLMRGARDLLEARRLAGALVEAPGPRAAPEEARPTLERLRELRDRSPEQLDAAAARELLRELKAVGGDLRAVRVALTGAERGPELWAVLVALTRDETLQRVDSALARPL